MSKLKFNSPGHSAWTNEQLLQLHYNNNMRNGHNEKSKYFMAKN